MNIRKQAKRRFQHRARQILIVGRMTRWIRRAQNQNKQEEERQSAQWNEFVDSVLDDARRRNELAALVEAPAFEETPEIEHYTVVRKTTGEIVAEFDTQEEAESLIEKHRRQKRAALCLSSDYLMSI